MTSQVQFDFSGKTALVTGSTQNLGYSIARAFAQCHARVIVHGPDTGGATDERSRLLSEIPGECVEAVAFDLGKPHEIDAGFADLEQRNIAPDILVNNAAHLGLGTSGFLEQSPDFFREVMEVNLFAPFRCAQLASTNMKSRGGGAIIQISSLGGERAIRERSAYNTSKAAIDGLTRSMALELLPFGIRVNAIAPGYVWTPRWDSLTLDEQSRRRRNIPAGVATAQEEIARLVLFLASDAAPTLVGSRLVIDGGLGIQQLPGDVAV